LPITHKLVTYIQNFGAPNEQANIDEVIHGCREQNWFQVFMKGIADVYGLSCVKTAGSGDSSDFELCKGYKNGGHLEL